MIVLSVKEPTVDYREHPWDTYELIVDFGDGEHRKVHMNRLEYAVFKVEQELLAVGVSKELIEKYHDAVREEVQYDCENKI